MSSTMKFSLLALISTAVAAPHNAFHRRHDHPAGGYGTGTGAPYPTGGWGHNSTVLPTGTGAAVPSDLPDTTILETEFSTKTLYSTIYASKPAQSAGAEDVSSAAPVCGPGGTVTVTATNKVTVTVPAGGASVVPSSSAIAIESSVVASSEVATPSVSAPGEGYGSYVLPSSSLVEEAPTSSAAPAATSSAEGYSILPVTSAAPATSAAPVTSEAPKSSSAVVEEASSTVVASSAAPSSTGTPSYSGGKRGLAYNDESLLEAFSGGSFGFNYNWAQTGKAGDSAFIPMMHKPSDSTAEDWLANVDKAVQSGSTAVMGFNEPDIVAQANLSPQDACSKWVEYMNPIASAHPDVTILGPSVSNSGSDNQGLSWLSQFTSACSDAVVHAANIHFYDIADGALERFKAHIEKAASQTGKKVWVTEFGLNPGSATEQQAADFLQGAMEYMDGSDSVAGYAYFMVGSGECQLNSGDGLSAVGKVYAA